MMKMICILLTAALLHAAAGTYAQSIVFSGNNVPLKKVFAAIKKQTGFKTFGNLALLEQAKPVSLSVNNMPLTDFLDLLLKDQPITWTIIEKTISLSSKAAIVVESLSPQTTEVIRQEVTGTLINGETKEPLAGATITIRGTQTVVLSDQAGRFSIPAKAGQVLVISFVGLETKEIRINASTKNVLVSLNKKVTLLQEAVVTTAYGIEKRTKELGYSVVKISGEDLNRTNPGNLLTGLTGKVSGLVITNQSPDMTPDNNIMLRGIRSINQNSNNQPLFILNGSPLSFGSDQQAASLAMEFLNNLNPNDIENVTVLKGANGAALYGPEGVNGVIIISTKRGEKNQLSVNFRTTTNFQKIDFRQRGIQKEFGAGDLTDPQGNPVYNPYGDRLWGPAYNNAMVPLGRPDENGDQQKVPYRYTDDRFNFWNTGRLTQNNLTISQGDNRSDFYLGLSYTDQAGLLPGDKQNKAGLLLNTGRQYNFWSVRLNLNYALTKFDKGPRGLATDKTPPHVPLTRYKDFLNDHWSDRNHYYSDGQANPYETIAGNRRKSTENGLSGNLEFKIRPLRWLTVTARPGLIYDARYSKGTVAPRDYSDFAKALGANGRWVSYRDVKARVSEETESLLTINNDLLISSVHRMGHFSLKTNIGNTIRESQTKEVKAGTSELVVPVYNLRFGTRNQTGAGETSVLSRFYSFFGTVMLGYQDKVFLELTGRNDWDSKLAVKARNKNFYAGANTSIVLTEIFPVLNKTLPWISGIRLRASVTRTANMNIKPYQAERILELSPGFPIDELVGYQYMTNNPNPFIQPERVISQEYGGNFSFLNQKVELDIAYYRQRNNGLILDVINSIYSGAPSIDNAGVYDNNGWEFDLRLNQLFKTAGGFTGRAELRFAINDNKVVALPPVYDGQLIARLNSSTVVARTGHHAFQFYFTDWKRDPSGRIIVDKQSGLPQSDRTPLIKGRTLPKYTASANFNIEWKKFNLYVLAEYRGGNDQYNDAGSQDMRMGWSALTAYNHRQPFVVPNSVYDDGTGKYVENTDVKVSSARNFFEQASWVSDYFLTNAGFLSFRELSLTYNLDLKMKKAMKKITLGIYGRDLFKIYAKGNLYGDPGMIRGPGWTREDRNQNGEGNGSNVGSAIGQYDRIPGIITYGFIINVGF